MRLIDADILKYCISRDAETVEESENDIFTVAAPKLIVKCFLKIIDSTPTVPAFMIEKHDCNHGCDVTQKWIPCSERLPEKSGRYLVTRKFNALFSLWDKVYIANYSDLMGLKKEKIWWSGNVGKSDFEKYDDVIAWQPLPEPYKT